MNLLGDYQSISLIHHGTNSLIYKARKTPSEPWVILKMPSAKYPSGQTLATVGKEFNYLRYKLSNLENIPTASALIDVGASLAIEMACIDAQTLLYEHQRQPLPLQEIIMVFCQLAKILSQLHQLHVIHRDINPSNVLYDRSLSQVSLIDFSAASDVPLNPTPQNLSQSIYGTLSYLSPEQTGRVNRAVDYRSDIYSLGVSFYEILSGHLPFESKDIAQLIHAHLAIEPAQLTHCPSVLNKIVMRCLAKEPSDRYQSAEGLHQDLSYCLDALQSMGEIPNFSLGQGDYSPFLLFPQALYGREAALATIKQQYRSALRGECAMVFITGESGIGKTSVVNEFHRTLAADFGYIISGKYEQYNNNQPYSGLIAAFSELVKHILSESDDHVKRWQHRIRTCLGINASLMADVIPAVGLLTGDTPPRQSLSPHETRTLLHRLFLDLLNTLGQTERPIVMFLDDLQWIDSASVALIELFGSLKGGSQLLLVGAYRSNEVNEHHPLAQMKTALSKDGVKLADVHLEPLDKPALQRFLADVLHRPMSQVAALNHLFYERTQGNPLFFRTLLTELFESGDIYFSPSVIEADKPTTLREEPSEGHETPISIGWHWNLPAIHKWPYADNVVDAIQRRLSQLPLASQDLLQWAASIGGQFSLDLLATLAKMDRQQIALELKPALSYSLIRPLYSDLSLYEQPQADQLQPIICAFTHDRIQQAAYHLIDNQNHSEQHFSIGRTLLNAYEKAISQSEGTTVFGKAPSDWIFDIIDHMEKAEALLTDEDEKARVAILIVLAGRKAKVSTAFADAARILKFGCRIAPSHWWQSHYRLMCDLHLEHAESTGLSGLFDTADQLFSSIEQQPLEEHDQLQLYRIKSKQYHTQTRYDEAIEVVFTGLKRLGIEIPSDDQLLAALFDQEYLQIQRLLKGRPPTCALELKENLQPDYLMTLELLLAVYVDGYLLGRNQLCLTTTAIMARLALEQGNNALTSAAHVNFGSSLCVLALDYQLGYQFGELGMQLADHYQEPAIQNITYHVFCLSVNHWKKPLSSSFELWSTASKLAQACGSPYAGYVFLQLPHVQFISGAPLQETIDQMRISQAFMEENHYIASLDLLRFIVTQPIRHLCGETNNCFTLDDDTFDIKSLISQFQDTPYFLATMYCAQMRVDCLTNQIIPISTLKQRMELIEKTYMGQITVTECCLFYGLLLSTARYANTESPPLETNTRNSLHCFDAQEYLHESQHVLSKMQQWAELCPENFEHKYWLLQAELTDNTLSFRQRLDKFELAIYTAMKQHRYLDAALAAERMGLFWARDQKPTIAGAYFEQARSIYSRWGACGMVDYLEQRYNRYIDVNLPSVQGSTITTEASTKLDQLSDNLDLMAVIKASQAISQCIETSTLAEKLLIIAMENAGATRGLLITRDAQHQWVIEEEINRDASNGSQPTADLPAKRPSFSETAVNYLFRTGELLVLGLTNNSNVLTQCPYLVENPMASLCCIPIKRQFCNDFVLYLEHRTLADTFSIERVQLLQIVAAQATISLDNSRAYQELTTLNKNLEAIVAQRTHELEEKNLQLQENNLTLHNLSTTDPLTQLSNRRRIEQKIEMEISRCERSGSNFSLMLLDIDHFKQVNDTFGHNVGDDVLCKVANTIKKALRKSDSVGRWGGEEFVVVVTEHIESTTQLAERLRTVLASTSHPQVGQVTTSIGISHFMSGDSTKTLVERADEALYCAKEQGRNRVIMEQTNFSTHQ